MFKNTHLWLSAYVLNRAKKILGGQDRIQPTDLFLCVCDHFEPYWGKVDAQTARKRITRWIDEYPMIADNHRDSDGELLKWTFFYPEEEYKKEDMDALAGLCQAGFGEVEIHLHHDNDTSDNLRRTLVEYKKRLRESHNLLSVDRETGELKYGFVHGNWALDNSRPDGRDCGVDDEISILLETGCYADFTMPSAPSVTQTKKVNSIYYAVDDPLRPKSHNDGTNARLGSMGAGLLMVQGPLSLIWKKRKYGIFPRIENGGIQANHGPQKDRISLWVNERIHVHGNPSWIFVKLYTHGSQEAVMKLLFDRGGLRSLFSELEAVSAERELRLHYVSAREMVNVIIAAEQGIVSYDSSTREVRYKFG